ncbi:MAG: OmpA family protein [Bacteroidales bacterium]|nr:OmpA family protein [Bacteroidales bacterium]
MINIPNAKHPVRFNLRAVSAEDNPNFYLKNIRVAKGAVPLYDRLASEGKIVTYAITFETGKADLKPESMVEINRIAKLMKERKDLKFEVQGHCDNTGSDKVNDPLSQKRAEAIVAELVKQGIDKSRLTAVGKGSHSPIADNSTDEGRAKNRRVEFVKK